MGCDDGDADGKIDGCDEGRNVGYGDGGKEGEVEGIIDGDTVEVGIEVGALVTLSGIFFLTACLRTSYSPPKFPSTIQIWLCERKQ